MDRGAFKEIRSFWKGHGQHLSDVDKQEIFLI
jgi:hypothetical protein